MHTSTRQSRIWQRNDTRLSWVGCGLRASTLANCAACIPGIPPVVRVDSSSPLELAVEFYRTRSQKYGRELLTCLPPRNDAEIDLTLCAKDLLPPLYQGPIRDAELLAADAFGAAKTWMLANGR